ncbi:putative inactive leucine-rich repeat receptor-like protein kinase [Dichanthelium oligosanthes]|uniref:Putative inactive leucine-rich repeat receptor-like protein kinase n=1 Tax=Dichanthelium oligosanthes TaxID=888268 RepID=A0A1E5WGL3_9POAL|nr:putative inactive leucine-rich repeat receptor-like protein kinase [Dichanthelium oligosanthes]
MASATTCLPLVLLLVSTLIAASTTPSSTASAAAQAPQELLLDFRASLQDPTGALSSWSRSTPYCNWPRVACTATTAAANATVSVSLSLQGLGLSGELSAASLCRVPGLVDLSLASNAFNQTVPLELSRCASLVSLNLSAGAFWGPLPEQLAALASLVSLDLSGNSIEGQVPAGLAALGRLEVLDLGGNRLSGVLHPALFGNLTGLRLLDLSGNQFTESELPRELGNLTGLSWLFLQGSGFTGAIPESFLGLEQLQALDLSMNSLAGPVPPGFGLRLQKLMALDLSQNGLSGPFPEEIGKCSMLQRFEVHDNAFTGELPGGLWSLPDLRVIRAQNNRFAGRLPEFPGGQSRLEQVQLDNNSFTGGVPQSIGLVRTLYRFSASLNELNGSLPDNICDSPAMSIINISRNSLSGTIPEFKNCKRLVSLYLAGNGFTGSISASLGDLPVLTYIDLSSNGLTGGIPAELQNLKLALLNVSYNQLTGRVPPSLISELPAVFLQGNPGLCGPGLPNDCDAPMRKRQGLAIAATVASFLTGVVLLAVGAFAACRRLHGSEPSPWKLVLFHPVKITVEELFAGFRDKNIIGRGAFGKVYLTELQDGQNIAVKRLLNSGKLTFRAVKNEMKALAKVRHKNIAKMLGFCYSDDEVGVIYDYLQMGSLQDLICAPKFTMGWKDRARIAMGVAQGLAHLHHDRTPQVLHRDLKASNVLLGDEFEPRITGFGIDRVVGEMAYQTSMASDLNYKCYIAPEQSCAKNPTHLMDVYSFGVILLELVTGKPAEQPASDDDSMDIVRWVRRRINVTDSQILDPSISRTAHQGMQAALELALRCTSVMPDQRPAMDEVVRSLYPLCFSVHPQTLLPTEIALEP